MGFDLLLYILEKTDVGFLMSEKFLFEYYKRKGCMKYPVQEKEVTSCKMLKSCNES